MEPTRVESSAIARRRRRAELDALKMSRGGCVDCGYNQHPAALHWDHIGGDKASGDRRAFQPSWAWARILAEIAKCELVCANCHAIRTADRGYTGGRGRRADRVVIVRGEFGREFNGRASMTHCKRGHRFDEANTYTWRDRRQCRTCNNARQRDRRRGVSSR